MSFSSGAVVLPDDLNTGLTCPQDELDARKKSLEMGVVPRMGCTADELGLGTSWCLDEVTRDELS